MVKRLLKEMDTRNMIICHNLKKVYRGNNRNPDKLAVRGLSLALHKGQCLGMLGPNGAGKSSFINMVSDSPKSPWDPVCVCCRTKFNLDSDHVLEAINKNPNFSLISHES